MRSNKRYTNTTFTRRVDHEAGRHRTRRAPKEPAICASCNAFYSHRRWTQSGTQGSAKAGHWKPMRVIVCPACVQAAPSGYVFIDGDFVANHLTEIESLLRNEAARAGEDNPLAKIASWQSKSPHGLLLMTTNEHLAQRLGHALSKAYHGNVDYDFSHENKLARVTWHRD
jgi:hypothetical protein